MGMTLKSQDLLPGEQHLMTKFANMVVSAKQIGLSRFAFDQYMVFVGMKGKEAIGGMAHLTNYRIIFKSHFLNRVRGKQSIFLTNVVQISASFNRLLVETSTQQFEFVMWLKKAFIDVAMQAQSRLNEAELQRLQKSLLSKPDAVGSGLQKWSS